MASAASGALAVSLPDDIGAAFRRNHEIGRVLQHGQVVAHADAQGATGTALADHDADDRGGQTRHHRQVLGDGLADAALLRIDPG